MPTMLDLARILRAAGQTVHEVAGWQSRGGSGFDPIGLELHHDGSAVGETQAKASYADWLFTEGRADLPPPLCHLWLDYDGEWWLGAAERANHSGPGRPWGDVPAGRANACLIGVEIDNTINEDTTPAQYAALYLALPAIFTAFGWDPRRTLVAHKEVSSFPGSKVDPDDIDMDQLRAEIHARMSDTQEDYMPYTKDELASIMRGVLNEGTAPGQTSWAATSKSTLAQVQGIGNRVGEISTAVNAVPVGTYRIKLTDRDAQYFIDGGARYWIRDQADLYAMRADKVPLEVVDADDSRWSLPLLGDDAPA